MGKVKKIILAIIAATVLVSGVWLAQNWMHRIKSGSSVYATGVTAKTVEGENATLGYTFALSYPELHGVTNQIAETRINSDLDRRMRDEINNFVNESNNRDQSKLIGNATSSLFTRFAVSGRASSTISFRFEHTPYYVGSAHADSFVSALNYDLHTGSLVTLDIFFPNDPRYLKRLSAYTEGKLLTQFGPYVDQVSGLRSWVHEGAVPTTANYSQYLVREDGLVIIFNPYQVAPYIFGEREVVIPWRDVFNLH